MSLQALNLGSAPNDGTGDNARAGGVKINANFSEVYTALGASAGVLPAALPVPQGGTGLTSVTAGQLLYGAGTSPLATSANLLFDTTNNYLQIGGAPTGWATSDKLQVNGNALINNIRISASAIRPVTAGTFVVSGFNASSGVGSLLNLIAGTAGANSNGGTVQIEGTVGNGTGSGGGINLIGKDAGTVGTGGNVGGGAGRGGSTSGTGGSFSFASGSARGTGNGGGFNFTAGSGGNTSGDGGTATFTAGGSPVSGVGGSVLFYAGDSYDLVNPGGSIGFQTGIGGSSGLFTITDTGLAGTFSYDPTADTLTVGNMKFGTYTAGVLVATGYVTITDSGGTTRRLLVG